MIKDKQTIKSLCKAGNSNDSSKLDNSTDSTFFCREGTRFSSETPLKNRYDILLRRIGLSQNKLAEKIEVSSSTMSYFANGIWIPSSETMIKICKILEVPTHVLYGDSPFWNRWHDSIIYSHRNANGKSELDSGEICAGQSPESSLNQPSAFNSKNQEVNKNE